MSNNELNPQENINSLDIGYDAASMENEDLVDIDLDEDLQKMLFFALDEAIGKLDEGDDVVPFTCTLAGDDIFVDCFDTDDSENCHLEAASALHVIEHLAEAYVLCYDGYIEFEDGSESDMLIAEVGQKDEPVAYAFGLIYEIDENNKAACDDALVDLGETQNLFDPKLVAAAQSMSEASANAGACTADKSSDDTNSEA